MTNEESENHAGVPTPHSLLDLFLDIPWGILIFLLLAFGGLAWTAFSKELTPSEYLTAVSGGAGLLAVGHGIREHGKHTDGQPAERSATSRRSSAPGPTSETGRREGT